MQLAYILDYYAKEIVIKMQKYYRSLLKLTRII